MSRAGILVWAIMATLSVVVAASALAMPAQLSGRLHPGHVPLAIAVIGLAAGLISLARRGRPGPGAEARPVTRLDGRVLVAAVTSVAVLGLATRALGVVPAVFVAAVIAALGMREVGLGKALVIGAGLSIIAALVFVVALGQPLPLLPGRW